MKIGLTVLAILAGCIGGTSAMACSVEDGYRAPTNLELVAHADRIFVGRIDDGMPLDDAIALLDQGQIEGWSVTIDPAAALKGALPDGPVTVEDGYLAIPGAYDGQSPSNPYELFAPHHDAMQGGCYRTAFQPGRLVLFFFSEENGTLRPFAPPFARWAEDVPSMDAPWVRTVQTYLEISALPEAEQRPALMAVREELLAAQGDPDAALIAADVNRQLMEQDRTWAEVMAGPDNSDDVSEEPESLDEAIESVGEMEALAQDVMREMDEPVRAMDDLSDADREAQEEGERMAEEAMREGEGSILDMDAPENEPQH